MNKTIIIFLINILAASPVMLTPVTVNSGLPVANTIRVTVENIRSVTGNVKAFLWRKGNGFPREKGAEFMKSVLPVTGNTVVVSFTDVPAGDYAVSLFHDENGNDLFDRDRIRKTFEPFGISMNPLIESRDIPYETARFEVLSPLTELNIRLNHRDELLEQLEK